jgi:methionine-rich copper-binding protein CopC
MVLRTPGDIPGATERPLRRFRLPAVLAGAVVLLLGTLAGASGAGVSNYQGTLYLDGGPSAVSGTSLQILTAAGPAVPAMPSAVAGGSGTLAMASYQYIQVTSSGGAYTASAVSNAPNVPANGSVTVSNLQVGADLYRAKVTSGVVLGNYVLASPPGGVTAPSYLDTGAISGAALPQADTRHPIGAPGVGWSDFVPGTGLATTGANSTVGPAPALPASCKGWIVDAAGGMSFPASNWTFARRVKPGAINNGTAVLTAAMWKVDDSGATVGAGYLISPTDGDVITNSGGTALTATVTANPGAFTLATNEHLCVQFGRHQTVAYTNGSTAHTITLLAYDPASQVTIHPAPNAFAAATLSSPADGSHTNAIPSLSATYSDADADAGTLTIRLCADSGCTAAAQSSAALAATNGATLSWTPTGPLADGTYYWDAQAQDGPGLPSAWTLPRSFVMDSVSPTTSLGPTPPAQSNAASGTFSFNADEAASGYQCSVDGAPFAGCSSPYSYGPLGDGPHTFDVNATDLAGNTGGNASHAWDIDATAPNTSITSTPASFSTDVNPSFSFSGSEAGATLECSLDGAFTSCASPKTYSGVADGAHTFQARAADPLGNVDSTPASYSWTIDTTPPNTTLDAPADGAWVHALDLSATFSETTFAGTGTIEFRLCSDVLCLGVVRSGSSGTVVNGALATWSPPALSVDGLYYWQARARDLAGNVSAWTATRMLHLDRVAPGKPLTFNGVVASDGLTLRWAAPNDTIANYVVFVNGAPWKNLGSTEFELKMGTFDPGDTRSFSVVAVDLAGNVGPMSPVLVGVPNVIGLTWPEALGATSERGLGLRRNAVFFASIPMVVASQDPPAPALTERGTAVVVTMSPATGAPLALKVKPGRFACAAGSVLRLRVDLSAGARVRSRLLNGHGRVVKRGQLGQLRAGTNKMRIKLPRGLQRGAYRLMLDATGEAGTAHALVRVKVGSRACRAH